MVTLWLFLRSVHSHHISSHSSTGGRGAFVAMRSVHSAGAARVLMSMP